jgi:hypothetical protein
LYYFYLLRYFNQIIEFTDSLNLKNLNQFLVLKNKSVNNKKPDELDRFTSAVNQMIRRIRNEVRHNEKIRLSLQQSEINLKQSLKG